MRSKLKDCFVMLILVMFGSFAMGIFFSISMGADSVGKGLVLLVPFALGALLVIEAGKEFITKITKG